MTPPVPFAMSNLTPNSKPRESDVDAADYFRAEYKKQTPLPRETINNFQLVRWVELRWKTRPNSVALLVNATATGKLAVWEEVDGDWVSHHVKYRQVVADLGPLQLPATVRPRPVQS